MRLVLLCIHTGGDRYGPGRKDRRETGPVLLGGNNSGAGAFARPRAHVPGSQGTKDALLLLATHSAGVIELSVRSFEFGFAPRRLSYRRLRL